MKKAFSLVEILIVIATLGIIAAIIIPLVQGHTQQAKETAAKENLRRLRRQIELYTVHEVIDSIGFDEFPENPFNNLTTQNNVQAEVPENATGEYGWILGIENGEIVVKLDWPGTDSQGVRYYDY